MQKALNVEAKEEKTEISCVLCMQDQVDEIIASGVDAKSCPFGEMVAAAAAEQPPCAEYLHTIALFVKECGCNGDLLRELDAFTKAHPPSQSPLPPKQRLQPRCRTQRARCEPWARSSSGQWRSWR